MDRRHKAGADTPAQESDGQTLSDLVTAWILVAIQALLLVGIFVVPEADHWPLPANLSAASTVLVAIGAGLGIWAVVVFGRGITPSPLPATGAQLITRGPYRWVRHPMYTAVMLFASGLGLRSRSWASVGLVAILVAFFHFKARWEERRLAATYAGYATYLASTARFLPFKSRRPALPT